MCPLVSGNSDTQLAPPGFLCLPTGQLEAVDVGRRADKYLEAKGVLRSPEIHCHLADSIRSVQYSLLLAFLVF